MRNPQMLGQTSKLHRCPHCAIAKPRLYMVWEMITRRSLKAPKKILDDI